EVDLLLALVGVDAPALPRLQRDDVHAERAHPELPAQRLEALAAVAADGRERDVVLGHRASVVRHARPGRAIVDERPPAGVATIHGMTRVIVDNSTGADAPFAAEITRELQRRGFETELRGPSPQARYD